MAFARESIGSGGYSLLPEENASVESAAIELEAD
jgi:hypothetical protein